MKRCGHFLKSLTFPVLAVVGAIDPGAGHAAEARQYSFYVGYQPGGQFDTYARLISRHMIQYMPGGSVITLKYMPGAGSRKLAQYLYAQAPKDGSEFGQLDNNVLTGRLLYEENNNFGENELTYIGSPSPEPLACILWHEVPVKTVEEAKAREMSFGSGSVNTIVGSIATIINKSVGTKFKTIPGYDGGALQFNAMERGELDGRCTSVNSILGTKGDWVQSKKLRFLIQFSPSKVASLGDVPLINDLVSKSEDRDALNLILAVQKAGFPLVAPPGIPSERTKMLRDAFAATMKDQNFRSEAERAGMLIDPVKGDFAAKTIADMYAASTSTVANAQRLLK